jgi:ankyrin repeat protein
MAATANEKAIAAILSHERTDVGAVTSMRNSNGDTALMFACSANRPLVVKMLLDRNAKETDSSKVIIFFMPSIY